MRVIADRYELVAFVGRGGMGEVWEGRDKVIGRRVAVKLLPDQQPALPPTCSSARRVPRAA